MKKSLKKILAGMLSAGMALSLSACGGSSGGTTSTTAAASNTTAAASGTTSTEASGSSSAATATEGNSYVIRIASSSPTVEFEGEGSTALGISVNYFIREIEARTGGRVTAQVFPDGQIASSTQEYIGGLQNGAFDVGILNCGSWADYTPAFAGLNVPYLYFDYDDAYAVLDSEIGEDWKKRAQEDTQTIPLAYFDIGFRELTANKPVYTPDDMKGIKIRTMTDPIQMACWEALGAAVTPVAYSELYTALQQKMVDAQENPPSNIVSSKVYELQKYCVKTNHNFTVTIAAASPIFWNGLSDSDKELISDLMIEAQNEGRKHTEELVDGFYETMKSNLEIIELDADQLKAFQDKAKSVWPKIEEQMGTEAYNKLINFVTDYQSKK